MLRPMPQFLLSQFTRRYALCLPLLTLAAGAAAAPLPVPEHSFLNYHAANVRELSQEVTLDPAVRARLANHFHISEAKMDAYVHQNLILTHLQKAGVYRVACVRPNGEEFWVESHLPAGTPIFASRVTGQPVLKLACGNPMVSVLPAPLIPQHPLAPPQVAVSPSLLEAATAPAPVLMADAGSSDVALASSDLIEPPVVQVSPSIQFLGSASSPSIFPALLGLGGAVAVFGHGGGSGSSVVTPPVPESSTVTSLGLLLLLGCGTVVLKRRKRGSVTS